MTAASDKQVADLLKAARGCPELCQKLSFEKLLLKFPQLEDGFLILEKAFNGSPLDTNTKLEDLKAKRITSKLAVDAQRGLGFPTNGAVSEQTADPDGSISFADFITSTAMTLIKLKASHQEVKADPEATQALELAVASFNHFDKDGNGSLTQAEVTGTLGEVDNSAHAPRKTQPGGGEVNDISQRWHLMDCDRDGRATFKDYISSLHQWVREGATE